MKREQAKEKAKGLLGQAILTALEAADLTIVYKAEYNTLSQIAKKETDPGVRGVLKRYGHKLD